MTDRSITVDEARTRWPCPEGYHLGSVWPIAMALSLGYAVEHVVDVGPPLGKVDVHVEVRPERINDAAVFVAYTTGTADHARTRIDADAADAAQWLGYLIDDGIAPSTDRVLRDLIAQHDAIRAKASQS